MRIKNILLIIAAITIVSCNCARDSEVYKLLQDVKSYIDEKPDSALAVLNGIDKDNLNNKALKAHYEYVWWNAKMKYNIPPDVESTTCKSQNLDTLWKVFQEQMTGYEYDTIVKVRNLNWEKQMKELLPQQTTLFVVGAGHLPGEYGMINLLREAGYKVKPVKK